MIFVSFSALSEPFQKLFYRDRLSVFLHYEPSDIPLHHSIGQVIYEIIEGYVKRYDSISDIHYWVQKKVYDLMGGNKNAVD